MEGKDTLLLAIPVPLNEIYFGVPLPMYHFPVNKLQGVVKPHVNECSPLENSLSFLYIPN